MGRRIRSEREWNHDIGLDWQLLDNRCTQACSASERFESFIPQPYRHCTSWMRLEGLHGSIATTPTKRHFIRPTRQGPRSVCGDRLQFYASVGTITASAYLAAAIIGARKHRFGAYGAAAWKFRCSVAEAVPCHDQPFSLALTLPPLAA